MVTFGEVLTWDTSDKFYRDIDIATCGLEIIFDGSLGYNYMTRVESVKKAPVAKWIAPNTFDISCNGYEKNYYGHPGENYFFLDVSKETLYSLEEVCSSDEDGGSSMDITARVGYMLHLNIHPDNRTAEFMDMPVKYQMIDYMSRSWGEGGTTGSYRAFPYFETMNISDKDDVSYLLDCLPKLYWKHPFQFASSFAPSDTPKLLQEFFIKAISS